jgi:uncharacterized protein
MRTEIDPLSLLLFGQTRARILALLFGSPDQEFYVRQVARAVAASPGAAQRELANLARARLIDRIEDGHQVYHRVNKVHPVFPELSSLIAKTVGVVHTLSAALGTNPDGISVAFIYGSMARGEQTAESDVDLMVIGTASLGEVLSRLADAERAIGRPINPTVYTPREIKRRFKEGNHFLRAVFAGPKVLLIGTEHDLERLGRVRVAQSRTIEC